ncbi:superoxide dismutase [Chaetomidium leptoderma]|uniref:superoxide dismutase n=1 Tax=Chaetomidium leptoderma TaxID=669021 RepID=A0AAN6VLP1_9PEZI|nr:superoxide dismutase [Chaetomidium leptoderma]
MRASTNLSLLLAAAGTHVLGQSTTSSSAASGSTAAATGELGDAAEVSNNPVDVLYKAAFPESAFFKPAYPEGGNMEGEVSAVANPDGQGVKFTFKLSNLPKIGAPITYHLHVAPVPENGNCTATLAHLDPYIRGETPVCDKAAPATCQVGDLSGKHGAIPADQDTYEMSYVDRYASTVDGIGAFFGNRSIVFHYPNKTRITCANFAKADGDDDGSANLPEPSSSSTAVSTPAPTQGSGTNGTGSGTGTTPPPSTSSVVLGAASGLRVGAVSAVVFGAAIAFML